jgi:hypothetical protein
LKPNQKSRNLPLNLKTKGKNKEMVIKDSLPAKPNLDFFKKGICIYF